MLLEPDADGRCDGLRGGAAHPGRLSSPLPAWSRGLPASSPARALFAEGLPASYGWKCDALNARSRAAALRLGFTFEGIFRQSTVYKGRSRDTAWYSVIDREWPELERAFVRWLDPQNFDEQGRQRRRLEEFRSGV